MVLIYYKEIRKPKVKAARMPPASDCQRPKGALNAYKVRRAFDPPKPFIPFDPSSFICKMRENGFVKSERMVL